MCAVMRASVCVGAFLLGTLCDIIVFFLINFSEILSVVPSHGSSGLHPDHVEGVWLSV